MQPPRNQPPESEEGTPVYTTGEVARALGVSVEAIRKWSDKGLLPFTPRRVSVPGQKDLYRLFSEEDLDRLRAWYVSWEETRPSGGRPPHVKRGPKTGEEGATA